jgi:predicted aminopeptidase
MAAAQDAPPWIERARTRIRDNTRSDYQALCDGLSVGQVLGLRYNGKAPGWNESILVLSGVDTVVGALSFHYADLAVKHEQCQLYAAVDQGKALQHVRAVVIKLTGREEGKPHRGVNIALETLDTASRGMQAQQEALEATHRMQLEQLQAAQLQEKAVLRAKAVHYEQLGRTTSERWSLAPQ